KGIPARRACDVAITALLTDEKEVKRAISQVVAAVFP
ncbi:MAG: AAA family ATPase, partial [Deltaproteobacteria bacterium]|nr:AAA family ATPase [Deltaproteobacteria bacterium]